jgi:hypothetical protein
MVPNVAGFFLYAMIESLTAVGAGQSLATKSARMLAPLGGLISSSMLDQSLL